MIPIVKFNRLPLPERWLFLKTAGLLVTIRLALRLLPFPVVRALLKRVSHPCRRLTTNPIHESERQQIPVDRPDQGSDREMAGDPGVLAG